MERALEQENLRFASTFYGEPVRNSRKLPSSRDFAVLGEEDGRTDYPFRLSGGDGEKSLKKPSSRVGLGFDRFQAIRKNSRLNNFGRPVGNAIVETKLRACSSVG